MITNYVVKKTPYSFYHVDNVVAFLIDKKIHFKDPDKPGDKPRMQQYQVDLNRFVQCNLFNPLTPSSHSTVPKTETQEKPQISFCIMQKYCRRGFIWSHHRTLSTNSKVGTTLHVSIIDSKDLVTAYFFPPCYIMWAHNLLLCLKPSNPQLSISRIFSRGLFLESPYNLLLGPGAIF